jgi:hypothetical protein
VTCAQIFDKIIFFFDRKRTFGLQSLN